MPEQKLAYSISQSSALTGLSRSTLYNLARAGRLPIRKVAGRSIVLHDDLMALLTAR